ncbi:uncharacterized protein YijF (DUF1287 family) [Caulobacter ginsengisoli]|uniref:Uncharacterized protein YijF (DUF1287 family) n=1 Tax=Caulobacter ginsengisoli TaxID=400775 RepID=A0ABU0ITN1_9CAUL|nr:DUF1287 domain-containing protein [Caulobacter ginsengisoli]MDQ0465368.1 uncharacterized protein YijF (DUF1287 family) [Caulobacter ginsengisoli]
MIHRRALLAATPALALSACAPPRRAHAATWAEKLLEAASAQIGTTVHYDPLYTRIAYPNGDVPREKGVCTDVVVRAYRDAFGIDLQRLVHEDMKRAFAAYPHRWGLKGPDSNIDHRRVPNLETFLTRLGAARPSGETWQPGDIITVQLVPVGTHIMLAAGAGAFGVQDVIHNMGGGTKREAAAFPFRQTGHFRWAPQQRT